MSIKAIGALASYINKRDRPSGLSIREIKEKIADFVAKREEDDRISAYRAGMEEELNTRTYAIVEGRTIEKVKIK